MRKSALEQKLSHEIDLCKRCPLYRTRKNAVAGEGYLFSKILIIGEAPGKREDEEKIPFAGRAGKVLDMLLKSVDLSRKDVYITNIVKCRPFPQKKPSSLSIFKCHPFLVRQIKLLQPKIIITLGSTASKELCKLSNMAFSKISLIHGQLFESKLSFGLIKFLPLYHPAAALRSIKILAAIKSDFKKNLSLFKESKIRNPR